MKLYLNVVSTIATAAAIAFDVYVICLVANMARVIMAG